MSHALSRLARIRLAVCAAAALSLSVTSCTKEPTAVESSAAGLPAPALEPVKRALSLYDEVRGALAADTLDGVGAKASSIAEALDDASVHVEGGSSWRALLVAGAERARALSRAEDLSVARRHFGALSDALVGLAKEDARLRDGFQLFSCPMTKGFQEWMQRPTELENPHMGQSMLRCGSAVSWTAVDPPSLKLAGADGHAHDEIAYHTCPMHPSVKQDGPGQCPICGMDLVPVTQAELESGVIFVDEARRQEIGVKTAPATRAPMKKELRAYGRVRPDEGRLFDVTLRFSGFVEELLADETGQEVKRGEPLLTIYSPELYAAQQELLEAARAAETSGIKGLLRAARARLRLAGLTDGQIDDVLKRGRPYERLPVFSPVSGVVLEKDVVEGARVEAGRRLFRVAPLDRVWVEADLYEADLDLVKEGQAVTVRLAQREGPLLAGTVSFLAPTLDERTRARRARVEVDNPDRALLPGMAADVVVALDLGERLQVPESAVVYTGPRRLVFVDEGSGRLRPQQVEVGARTATHVEVTKGLSEGDVVVVTGTFLVASESRIRNAATLWGGATEGGDHAGH